jgi:hypothetical protein
MIYVIGHPPASPTCTLITMVYAFRPPRLPHRPPHCPRHHVRPPRGEARHRPRCVHTIGTFRLRCGWISWDTSYPRRIWGWAAACECPKRKWEAGKCSVARCPRAKYAKSGFKICQKYAKNIHPLKRPDLDRSQWVAEIPETVVLLFCKKLPKVVEIYNTAFDCQSTAVGMLGLGRRRRRFFLLPDHNQRMVTT